MPLGFGHLRYGRIRRSPNPVIGNQNIESAEGSHCRANKSPSIGWSRQLLLNGKAMLRSSARSGESLGLFAGAAIAEGNACSGGAEQTYCFGPNAARASADEGDLPIESQ